MASGAYAYADAARRLSRHADDEYDGATLILHLSLNREDIGARALCARR